MRAYGAMRVTLGSVLSVAPKAWDALRHVARILAPPPKRVNANCHRPSTASGAAKPPSPSKHHSALRLIGDRPLVRNQAPYNASADHALLAPPRTQSLEPLLGASPLDLRSLMSKGTCAVVSSVAPGPLTPTGYSDVRFANRSDLLAARCVRSPRACVVLSSARSPLRDHLPPVLLTVRVFTPR